jgi:hypothetical protein
MDPLGWVCEIGRGEIAIARLFNRVSPGYSSESQLLRGKMMTSLAIHLHVLASSPRCDFVCGSCNVGVNPPRVQRFQAVGTVRAKTPEDRKGGKSRRREVAVHRSPP